MATDENETPGLTEEIRMVYSGKHRESGNHRGNDSPEFTPWKWGCGDGVGVFFENSTVDCFG
ncbi:hypothetical protein, partial [Saccharopolyspora sp. NPDC049426]|uniref:hypothetical protein n=1 Tax=Saccharopolyspora sp. NPDC049426 TaxID=3155652 RepID=UPI0034217670